MKRLSRILLIAISCFLCGNTCLAQTPAWAWAIKGTSTASVTSAAIGTDAAGNTYSTGYTFLDISFGNLPPLPKGMFLVKHSAQGIPVWAVQANCQPYASATDSAGNTFVTGYFENYPTDTLVLGNDTLICEGRQDIFIAKFDSMGNVLWAKKAGGLGYHPLTPILPPIEEDEGFNIATDAEGNCYISANVLVSDTSAAYFDSVAVYPSQPTLFPRRISVLAKYNTAGQVEWVRRVSDQNSISLYRKLAVSPLGDCVVYGTFNYPLYIGGDTLISNGGNDIVIASFNSAGDLNWAAAFGGPGDEYAGTIAVGSQANIFISGSFKTPFQIGPFALAQSASNSNSLFLAKFSGNGDVLWASQTTGPGYSGDSQIAVDQAGNSYVSCTFSDSIYVGSEGFHNPHAGYDILVSKWGETGQPLWAVAAQGAGSDYPKGIALNSDYTACYVAGSFEQNLGFSNNVLQTGQNASFFLAKLENIVSGAPPLFASAGWSIYPNPAHHSFFVALADVATVKSGKFFLYNITGQLVREIDFAGQSKIEVNRSSLPAGLYIYKLQAGSNLLGTGKITLH